MNSTTSATPIGACPDCGQMRYANLTHHCGTSLRPGQVAAAQQPIVVPLPGWRIGPETVAAAA